VIFILATDIPGWIGAFGIVLAFYLLTHKSVYSHSYLYLGLNLIAGALLAYDAWIHKTFAGLTLNLIWIIIAIYGLGWAHKRKAPKMAR